MVAAMERAGEILDADTSPFSDKRGPAGALPVTTDDGEDG
jgi:hypothetical protein